MNMIHGSRHVVAKEKIKRRVRIEVFVDCMIELKKEDENGKYNLLFCLASTLFASIVSYVCTRVRLYELVSV